MARSITQAIQAGNYYKLSWNQGRASVSYPGATSPTEALKLAIKECGSSLEPGTTVRVQRVLKNGFEELGFLSVPTEFSIPNPNAGKFPHVVDQGNLA